MGLVLVRLGAAVGFLGFCLLAFRERRRLLPWLRDYFFAPISPATLGLLRLVLLGLLWSSARRAKPEWHAALPAELRVPPFGWDLLGSLPFHPGAAADARDLLLIVSAAAALGLFTRVTVPLSALLAVYVFGLPQCFGKVNHGGHARMLAVLALSLAPSGDAFSIDALLRRARGHGPPPPSAAYALPVRAVWLLIGTTYLFPGLWKLLESGDLWMSGEQLRSELYRRWGSSPGFRPLVRPDQHAWSLPLLGTGTLVFEVGFLFAMFDRRARILAALGAVGFHVGVAAVMGIRFPPYVPLLVLLEAPSDWGPWGRRLSERWRAELSSWWASLGARVRALRPLRPPTPFPRRGLAASSVLCAALLVAQIAAGVTRTSSFPISVYPTFSARKPSFPTHPQTTRIVLETTRGEVRDLGPALLSARVSSVNKVIGRLADRAASRSGESRGRVIVELFRYLGVPVEAGDHVVVMEAEWDLFPIGKREGFREWTARRFVVRQDDTLGGLNASRRPELALNE